MRATALVLVVERWKALLLVLVQISATFSCAKGHAKECTVITLFDRIRPVGLRNMIFHVPYDRDQVCTIQM